jgi:hypothetical protein
MALFPESYISPEVIKAMPQGFIVRPLSPTDYEKGAYNIQSAIFPLSLPHSPPLFNILNMFRILGNSGSFDFSWPNVQRPVHGYENQKSKLIIFSLTKFNY